MKFKNAILLLGLFSLGIAFNNFSQTQITSQIRGFNAGQSMEEKIRSLAKAVKTGLPAGFCEDSGNYSCLEKKFTSQDSSLVGAELPCVKLLQGGEICPEGKIISINNQAAKMNCGSNCQENYDFTEYSCHLKLQRPGENLYPLVLREEKLSDVIDQLHDACVKIKSEQAQ